MIITTSNKVEGNEIGLVSGSYVASKAFYKDFFAGVRNFFGWEIKEYTKMLEEAREKATDRMEVNARKLGAVAVINVRFATAQTARGAAEIIVYGTAVRACE